MLIKQADDHTEELAQLEQLAKSGVLVAASARIDRPRKFDASRVIKADQIKERIGRDFDNENALMGLMKTAAKIVSGDTVRDVAQQLANLHRPAKWPMPAMTRVASYATVKPTAPPRVAEPTMKVSVKAITPPPATAAMSNSGPQCKKCQGHDGNILYGKYGYYFQCASCQTNTAIKFTCQPGHQPRLRKAGNQFFRECAKCNSSEPYFTNA